MRINAKALHSPRLATRARRGFTLIEVLAAVLLIDVGLLALVASSSILVRRATAARARAAALELAANRLQLLGVGGCATVAGESIGPHGTREAWSAAPRPNAVRDLVDSVTFVAAGATHMVILRTRLPC